MSYLTWLYGTSQACAGILLALIVLHIVDWLVRWRGGRGVL